MCGIAGAFHFAPDDQPIDQSIIARMNELQRRRGPDGTGLWASDDRRVVLGHRRLAIIDPSPAGAQPMADSTGRWVITYNGEIYNYKQLRSELEHLGCRFLTDSDTEVLINIVARWGETGLLKLRGMYAFALWDRLQQELWLVRDPYGIKPLYVMERQGTVWFASQARALANGTGGGGKINPAGVTGFFLWGYVPEPFCWWDDIHPLQAGHVQRYRIGRMASRSVEYASVQDAYINHPMPALRGTELRQLMLDSVRHHLVSDVPVGLFLSAGIDSTVLATMATELGVRLHTVTLAFDEYIKTPDDEAPHAENVAKLLRTDHATVRINRDEFQELLHDFFGCMDQPSTDGLNTYLVSRAAARQGLKVALSGLGGDELFGGYPSFQQIPRLRHWGQYIPASKTFGPMVAKGIRAIAPAGLSPKLARVFSYSGDVAHAYVLRRALYLEEDLDEVLDEKTLSEGLHELATVASVARTAERLAASDATDYAQVAALESCWYMRNQLLRDADWASMAHGLEVRVPYADLTLLARLGPAIGSTAPPTKRDLANCSELTLAALIQRPKTGFTTPVRQWLAQTNGVSERGLRGWASRVAREFGEDSIPHPRASAAPAVSVEPRVPVA
jgi:asparagine synthase (glutamine-hydrolysing)